MGQTYSWPAINLTGDLRAQFPSRIRTLTQRQRPNRHATFEEIYFSVAYTVTRISSISSELNSIGSSIPLTQI